MLVSGLQKQVLHQQPNVVEHAVFCYAIMLRRRLQRGDSSALLYAAALGLHWRRRRPLVFVDFQQETVKLCVVDVHAAGWKRTREGQELGEGLRCAAEKVFDSSTLWSYLLQPLTILKKRLTKEPSLPDFAKLSAKLRMQALRRARGVSGAERRDSNASIDSCMKSTGLQCQWSRTIHLT